MTTNGDAASRDRPRPVLGEIDFTVTVSWDRVADDLLEIDEGGLPSGLHPSIPAVISVSTHGGDGLASFEICDLGAALAQISGRLRTTHASGDDRTTQMITNEAIQGVEWLVQQAIHQFDTTLLDSVNEQQHEQASASIFRTVGFRGEAPARGVGDNNTTTALPRSCSMSTPEPSQTSPLECWGNPPSGDTS